MPAKENGRGDAILRAVGFAAQRFLGETAGWEESIEEVLERLGTATGVSRVYIFENRSGDDGEVWGTRRYEWVAPDVSEGAENPLMKDFPYRGYGRWVELWERGEVVHGHTREFPHIERPELEAREVLSTAIAPVFVAGRWWGQIGFDECRVEREWSATEIDALKAVAGTLGAAIERRRTEEASKQSEQLYRAVIEQATENIFLVDVASKRIVQSNPAFRETLGYSEEELRLMTLYDIVNAGRESIDRNVRKIVELKSPSVGERGYRRKDGSLLDVEVSASNILLDGRKTLCVVAHDVTERKRAEEERKESQRTLLTLMSNLPGMAYRCRNDPDWTMEFVSEGCADLTGYPLEDLLGNRVRAYGDLIHADDADPVWNDVQAALDEQRPFQIAYRITTASETEKWVWEQGRGIFSPAGELLALEGFVTDVTERVRAFEMLEQRVAALSRISADLTLDLPMESALDVLAEGVVQTSSAVACAVILADEEAGTPPARSVLTGYRRDTRPASRPPTGPGRVPRPRMSSVTRVNPYSSATFARSS